MEIKSFEQFLREKHAKEHPEFNKDTATEGDYWLSNMNGFKLIELAEKWHRQENKIKNEDILIQLTKAVRLLDEEDYNDKCLDPMRKIVNRLRKEMNVSRVKTDTEEKIIYLENERTEL